MTPQPTLAAIPGILLRTVLGAAARLLFIVGGVILLLSALLLTWRSARTPRTQAIVNLALAALQLWRVTGGEQ